MTQATPGKREQIVALLDTCALLPPRLSDILFDLALARLYFPHWTKQIEKEFLRNWPQVVGMPADSVALAEHRLDCFRGATRGMYEIADYRPYYAKVPARVDKKDRHVVAAALALRAHCEEGERAYLVSSNLRHLAPPECEKLGLIVLSPGAFIDELNASSPDDVERAVRKSIKDLLNPPITEGDLLDCLRLHAATRTADRLAVLWAKPNAGKKRR